MEYYVDRIEADEAVCETTDGETLRLPLIALPEGAREGSVLREEEGVFILDDTAAEARRATLFALQEALFGDDADA